MLPHSPVISCYRYWPTFLHDGAIYRRRQLRQAKFVTTSSNRVIALQRKIHEMKKTRNVHQYIESKRKQRSPRHIWAAFLLPYLIHYPGIVFIQHVDVRLERRSLPIGMVLCGLGDGVELGEELVEVSGLWAEVGLLEERHVDCLRWSWKFETC